MENQVVKRPRSENIHGRGPMSDKELSSMSGYNGQTYQHIRHTIRNDFKKHEQNKRRRTRKETRNQPCLHTSLNMPENEP